MKSELRLFDDSLTYLQSYHSTSDQEKSRKTKEKSI